MLLFEIFHHLESTTYANSANSGCDPNDHDLIGTVGELTPFAWFSQSLATGIEEGWGDRLVDSPISDRAGNRYVLGFIQR